MQIFIDTGDIMLQIKNLHKKFGKLEVLKGIDITANTGEVLAIIGPSGTGKSTLLRCINFLEMPDVGTIEIDDIKVNVEESSPREIVKLRKKTAMVFQNYCLFKNKTVLENVMLPLSLVQKQDKKSSKEEAVALIDQVGLLDKMNEFPARLSGGQQQRIGIARALAVHPKVILLDEPTSSLDPELVGGVLEIIRKLSQAHNCTMLLVTHEMSFAMDIADQVIFMDQGYVLEKGPPRQLIENTKSEKIKKYLNVAGKYSI